jgi:predicted permease
MWVNPFLVQIVGQYTGQLLVLLGAVGLVLLIACSNVASMLLARGASRHREVAIRASIGAGRKRITTQLLTESTLLAILGGTAGVLLGYWCIGVLKGAIPPELPRAAGIAMDRGVLIFAVVLTMLAGVLFGLTPALTAARVNISGAMSEGSRSLAGGKARYRLLRGLAIAQLALAFMLTSGAVLLYKSYQNVLATPQNFETDSVLTASLALSGGDYEEPEIRAAFWENLVGKIDALPGVDRAAVTTKLPLEGGTNTEILAEGEAHDPGIRRRLVEQSWISPGYFEAMGISLISGRVFEIREGSESERVAVVNRAFVDRYWPDKEPVGQRFRANSAEPEWSAVVIGVVENVRQWGPEYRPLPEMYFPYYQWPSTDSKLIVRSTNPRSLVPAIREELSGIDANQPIATVRTMGDVMTEATRGRQFLLGLVSLFAIIALILAVAGIFGIMSHNVAQRTREIGTRVAFGAANSNLVTMIILEVAKLAGLGLAVGTFLIVVFGVFLRSQLFGVGKLSIVYLSFGAVLMLAVALLASAIPALRAVRVDPCEALRTE